MQYENGGESGLEKKTKNCQFFEAMKLIISKILLKYQNINA